MKNKWLLDMLGQCFENTKIIAEKIRKEKNYADDVGISLDEIINYMTKDLLPLKANTDYEFMFQNCHSIQLLDCKRKNENR